MATQGLAVGKGCSQVAAEKIAKTNAMRILEREKISYIPHAYQHEDGKIDGLAVAQKLGQNPEQVFKTLVAVENRKNYYVFVIPVGAELDLKKAARAVGEKSVEMLHLKDLTKVTGYIRGGCSPIGMKKQYVTAVHQSCLSLASMMVSGGKVGLQVELAPADLLRASQAITGDLIQEGAPC